MCNIITPDKIPKFTDQLPIPPVFIPKVIKDEFTGKVISHDYVITMSQFKQQLLPTCFPMTTVWGYGGKVKAKNCEITKMFKSTPGATIDAIRGIPINVQWVNSIIGPNLLPVDPTLHWADPNKLGMVMPDSVPPFPPGLYRAQKPVPLVTHLHGGETYSAFDGHPDAWFTSDNTIVGPEYASSIYNYLNTQPSTTLWYHDHALGITRLNVLLGLAGFYIIRDNNNPLDKPDKILPDSQYEIPLVLQDRTFEQDGSFDFPTVGVNPDVHPYWVPEFFGNAIMVNGKVWPNLNVDRREYRFRLLNGSNARFYELNFSNDMEFIQIGSDGGYLERPVKLNSLLLAPAERADILVDFSKLPAGTKLILENHANAPFPDGETPDPEGVGQIMQFKVMNTPCLPHCKLPAKLNNIPQLIPDVPKRTLVLFEVEGENGPLEVLLNGQKWSAPITETPVVGSTEEWEIVNLTQDTHPIHLHLVQFQLKDRQNMDIDSYTDEWILVNGEPPLEQEPKVIPILPYLIDNPIPPDYNERGWKDTIRVNPNQVTRLLIRFAPLDADESMVKPGVNLYPFNPTTGPGYVWHCHILDHEDNEMMRPMEITNIEIPMEL